MRFVVMRNDVALVVYRNEAVVKPRHLSRIEAFERGDIIRVLSTGHPTMAEAAIELGMSRATLYRKIAQYDIDVQR